MNVTLQELTVFQLPRAQPVALSRVGAVDGGTLVALAEGVAAALPDAGHTGDAQPEVLVICGDRVHVAAACLGTWLRGYRVALAPNDRLETLAAIREHRRILAVVGDGQAETDVDVRRLEPVTSSRRRLAFPGARGCACVYTSGTTGRPTAHEKSFAQLLGEAHMLAERFSFVGSRVLATVPPHHIYGFLAGILAPLVGDGTFICETPLHPAQILDAAIVHGADTLVASPAHLQAVVSWHHADGVPATRLRLRRAFCSGAPLPGHVAERFHARWGLHVTELFGSTETGGIAHRTSPGDAAWTALPGVDLKLHTEDESSVVGLLRVRSQYVGGTDWYVTADEVELLADGGFVHQGRGDDVVKVGGRRVNLSALQSRIAAVPGVRDVALLASAVPAPRQVEIGCVVVAPGVSIAELRAALLQAFDPVAVPRRWRFLNEMPRELNGKLSRARLEAAFSPDDADERLQIACETRTRTDVQAPVSERHVRFSIFVPHNAWFFRGHFDGDPLVPGVVQVSDVVVAHAARAFADMPPLRQATRLKFKHPIRPGDLLTLNLKWAAQRNLLTFDLAVGERECSSGVLQFGGLP